MQMDSVRNKKVRWFFICLSLRIDAVGDVLMQGHTIDRSANYEEALSSKRGPNKDRSKKLAAISDPLTRSDLAGVQSDMC